MPRRFLNWLFALAFFVLLATVGVAARADQIATHGSKWVRITDKPCTDPKVLAWIQQRGLDAADFRAGTANMGVPYQLCWIAGPGGVFLIYEDGDAGKIDLDELHSVPES